MTYPELFKTKYIVTINVIGAHAAIKSILNNNYYYTNFQAKSDRDSWERLMAVPKQSLSDKNYELGHKAILVQKKELRC